MPNKFQTPNPKREKLGCFGLRSLGHWLLFDDWNLEIGDSVMEEGGLPGK